MILIFDITSYISERIKIVERKWKNINNAIIMQQRQALRGNYKKKY